MADSIHSSFETGFQLYEGKNTQVFNAIRKKDRRPVVLKIRKSTHSPHEQNSLAAEFDHYATIESAYTTDVLGLAQYAGETALILADDEMNRLEGMLPNEGISLPNFFTIATQLVEVVGDLHSQQLTHRDINPENILVDHQFSNIRLIDFDRTSRFPFQYVSFKTVENINGHLAFLAPEQTGRTIIPEDHRSDLYALGAVFYYCLTGQPPFTAESKADLLNKVVNQGQPDIVLEPFIPETLASLILKLLNKNPSQRYQNIQELKQALQNVQTSSNAKSIDLARNSQAHTPCSSLIHQDAQNTLISAFANCSFKGQLILIEGEAGFGKSTLSQQVLSYVTRYECIYIRYQFDANGQNAMVNMLSSLLDQLAEQFQDLNQTHKQTLISGLREQSELCAILFRFSKKWQELLGEQPQLPELNPVAAHERCINFIASFLNQLATLARPIAISFIDLTFADIEAVALVKQLTAKASRNMVLILSTSKNSKTLISEAQNDFKQKNDLEVHFIRLNRLTQQELEALINDGPADQTQQYNPKSEIIEMSSGDPLLLRWLVLTLKSSSIKELQLLLKPYIERPQVLANNSNDNFVVEPVKKYSSNSFDMLQTILNFEFQLLKPAAQKLLFETSCLTTPFSCSDLEVLLGYEIREVEQLLTLLIHRGFIYKVDRRFKFSHSRVQGFISQAHGDKARRQVSEAIALKWLLAPKTNDLEAYVQKRVLPHINRSNLDDVEPDMKFYAASLNYTNAEQCLDGFSPIVAQAHLQMSADLTRPSQSSSHQSDILAVKTLQLLANLQFWRGNYKEGSETYQQLLQRTTNPEQIAALYISQIVHYQQTQQLGLALNACSDGFAALKLSLQKRFITPNALYQLYRLNSKIEKLGSDAITNMAQVSDPLIKAQLNLLANAVTIAYSTNPKMYLPLVVKINQLTLDHGLSPQAASGFVSFGAALSSLGFHRPGQMCANIGLKLLDDDKDNQWSALTHLAYGMLVHHWQHPAMETQHYFEKATATISEGRGLEYAAVGAYNSIILPFYQGRNLHKSLFHSMTLMQKLKGFQREFPIFVGQFHQTLLKILVSTNHAHLNPTEVIEAELSYSARSESNNQKVPSHSILALCEIAYAQLYLFSQDYTKALHHLELAAPQIKTMRGTMFQPHFHFLAAYTLIACCRVNPLKVQLLARAFRHAFLLRRAEAAAPQNYSAKMNLIDAELSAATGKTNKSLMFFESAIAHAIQSHNNYDLALSHESMGRRLLQWGAQKLGEQQLRQAYETYLEWGAVDKARRLQTEFNLRRLSQVRPAADKNTIKQDSMPLETLSKNINTLSVDLDPKVVISKLLLIALQNSGGTRAIFMQVKRQELTTNAIHIATSAETIHLSVPEDPQATELPYSLIYHAWQNTDEPVVENIATRRVSHPDKIISTHSILIIPILQQGHKTGLLYIEHDTLEDAFTEEQVRFLVLLAGQAAIAFEHASLFTSLKAEQQYSSNIIENSPTLICGTDPKGFVTFINPATETVTGFNHSDLIGQNGWAVLYPGRAESQFNIVGSDVSGNDLTSHEIELRCKNGTKRNIAWSRFSKTDSLGKVEELIFFGTDLTAYYASQQKVKDFNLKLKQEVDDKTADLTQVNQNLQSSIEDLQLAQTQLIESEKMAALGGLVAGVAHEINTPIGISVTGMTHFIDSTKRMRKKYDDQKMTQQDLEEYFDSSSQAAELTFKNLRRASDLIKSFKQISVDQTSEQLRRFNMYEYIHEILSSVHSHLSQHKVTVDVECAKDIEIESYPGVYAQLLNNLLMNSIMHGFDNKETGHIWITAKADQEMLTILYKDNGHGIKEDIIKRVFDPFFSTKVGKGGSGLGLNIVYNIVYQQLHGTLHCESDYGHWTEFKVQVPLSPKLH